MNNVSINSSKTNSLEFEVAIQGIQQDNISIHFVVEHDSMHLSFPAENKEGNKWVVTIPPLPELLSEESYPFHICAVVNESDYFRPIEGTVSVSGVTVDLGKSDSSNKQQVSVSAISSTEENDSEEDEQQNEPKKKRPKKQKSSTSNKQKDTDNEQVDEEFTKIDPYASMVDKFLSSRKKIQQTEEAVSEKDQKVRSILRDFKR